MLLQVMAYPRDVDGNLHTIRESYPGHLSQGRVRLLGSSGIDPGAYPSLLGRASQGGSDGLLGKLLPTFSY